jgi:hypothetical protein
VILLRSQEESRRVYLDLTAIALGRLNLDDSNGSVRGTRFSNRLNLAANGGRRLPAGYRR